MKKWNLLLSVLLLAGAVFVTSCNKDEDEGPSLSLKGGAAYTSTNTTINPGESILVGVVGTKGTNNLVRFTLTATHNNVPSNVFDSAFNSANFNKDYSLEFSAASLGETRLSFKLYDKDGNFDEKSFVITVEDNSPQPVAVTKRTNVTLGSSNDAQFGSFYSTKGVNNRHEFFVGETRTTPAIQSSIDFIFFKDNNNGNAIAAPDASEVNNITTFQLNQWTVTKNATRFQLTNMTAAEFDAIGSTYVFPTFTGQLRMVNQLQNNNVISFKTAEGKLGLIKIVDLFSRGDRARIDVIVEN